MNRVNIKYILFILLALVFQATFSANLKIYIWRPDFVMIALVMFSLRRENKAALTAGFASGLLQDLLSTHFLGLAALCKTVASAVVCGLRGKFSSRAEFVLILLIASLIHDFLYFLIYGFGESFQLRTLFFLYAIPNALYTLLVGIFIHFLLYDWLENLPGERIEL
ncbi:MAG: hypothetical protein Kow0037_07340 [Calditrichia bacterium]